MDIIAPLENISTFTSLICFELGIRACPPLSRVSALRNGSSNGFHIST